MLYWIIKRVTWENKECRNRGGLSGAAARTGRLKKSNVKIYKKIRERGVHKTNGK